VADPPDEQPRRRSALGAAAQAVVLLAALAYIVWMLAGQWEALRSREWTLDPAPALLSLPLAAGWFLCRVWLWQRLLAAMGHRLAYGRVFRVWVLSALGRYLPGKVWYVLGRSYLSRRQGVPAPVALTAMVFELALVALAATAFFPIRAVSGGGTAGISWAWAGGVVLILLAAAHPRVVAPVVNAALQRMGRAPIAVRLSYRTLLGMFALCLLMWGLLSGGFALLAASMAPVTAREAVAVGASFPVAWVVGLIAFVSPGGLGVREGVLAALLAGPLPGGMAVVAALASRVWLTLVELLCAAAAWRMRE